MIRRPSRNGSALIAVLLLLILLTVLAAQISMRAAVDTRATENRLTGLQAQWGLQGALAQAAEMLKADTAVDQTALSEQGLSLADWPGEAWAQPVRDLPLGDGTCSFVITDEGARWDLGQLVTGPSNLLSTSGQAAFGRLAEACMPGVNASDFQTALWDWIDGDSDGQYETGVAPLPPNRPLLTAKEMLLVPMATTEILLGPDGRSGILPRVTTLGTRLVNANTAPREVLYAVSDRFDEAVYQRLLAARPLRNLEDLKPVLQVALSDPLPTEILEGLSIRSDTFRVSMSYAKGGDVRRATAVLLRASTGVSRLRWDPDPVSP